METSLEQHELYENARIRVQQKKRLYYHFVLFLIGSVFLIILNKFLKLGENYIENWFVWAIVIWFFLLIFHFINVFFINRFLGKEWERKQTEKLVAKQEKKIAQLSKKIEKKLPSPSTDDEIAL
jgi:amino acid permease